MKYRLTIVIGILLAAVLVIYMICFQVRYDQVAVRTWFAKATPRSVKTDPGFYMKWPWPIQGVHKYNTRLRILDDQLEQFQTADGFSIVVRLYTGWKISDPLQFYSNPETPERAEKRLKALVQDLRKVVSRYRFDQLVNTDPEELLIDQIEAEALQTLQAQVLELKYGLEVKHVGIRRIVLPEDTTQQVFERMRKTRDALAANIKEEGKAEATKITSEAESMRDRILTFAQRRAQEIRTEGDAEANKYLPQFQKNPDLAVFLTRLAALKEVLKENTTFVIDVNQLSEFNLFNSGRSPGSAGEDRPAHER